MQSLDHTVLNALAAQVAVLDSHGNILAVNEAWRRFARENGASASIVQGIGINYLDICPAASDPFAEDAQECLAGVMGALNSSLEEFKWEYPYRSPTEERWFLLHAVPLRRDAGGLIIFHIDITERKRAETALREDRKQVQLMLDSTAEGIYSLDLKGRCTFCNRAALRMLGYADANDVLGKNMHVMIHHTRPDGAFYPMEECQVFRAVRQGKGAHVDNEVLWRSDATSFPVEYWSYPIRRAGEIVGAVVTFLDVTERLAAQDRAQQYFDMAGVMFVVLDRNGVVAKINRKGCEILGYDEAEIVGKNWFDTFLPQAVRGEVRSVLQQLLAGEVASVEHFENLVVCRNGEQRLIAWHNSVIRDENGQIQFALGSGEDVTEQRAAEEQLRQAQKMEAIGKLTGGVAHDFNNLLAIMSGNLELLHERLAGQTELQDLAQRALTAAERGATLVQRLLAFSRQQPLKVRSTNLNKLVTGIIDLLQRSLGETIQIQAKLSDELWSTLIDPAQLENALLNLALNARDAMPRGGKLTIETGNSWFGKDHAAYEDIQPGPYVMLAVSDSGIGMAPEVVEHVFEPFFTTKNVGEGSGLGLSMVYGLVKQSGGHVKVSSAPGRGTIVQVYLPRTDIETAPAGMAKPPEIESGSREATILVVEDDAGVRQMAVKMLQNLGYRTVEAESAQAALAILDKIPQIALLFSDIVLPGGMSGADLAQEVKRRYPGLKVLLTSGYTDKLRGQKGYLAADVELVSKPYQKAQLAHKLQTLLGKD